MNITCDEYYVVDDNGTLFIMQPLVVDDPNPKHRIYKGNVLSPSIKFFKTNTQIVLFVEDYPERKVRKASDLEIHWMKACISAYGSYVDCPTDWYYEASSKKDTEDKFQYLERLGLKVNRVFTWGQGSWKYVSFYDDEKKFAIQDTARISGKTRLNLSVPSWLTNDLNPQGQKIHTASELILNQMLSKR
jgi:hypothetical protein